MLGKSLEDANGENGCHRGSTIEQRSWQCEAGKGEKKQVRTFQQEHKTMRTVH